MTDKTPLAQWGVRYLRDIDDEHRVLPLDEDSARTAVKHAVPTDGTGHTLVRLTGGSWEEVTEQTDTLPGDGWDELDWFRPKTDEKESDR